MTATPASCHQPNQYRQHSQLGAVRRAVHNGVPALQLTITVPLDDEALLSALASSPSSPSELLRMLGSNLQNITVTTKTRLARNETCPPAALRRLAQDPAYRVVAAVTQNPSCSASLLRSIYQRDENHDSEIAVHPNCPPQILKQLAERTDVGVRYGVAGNPSCPIATLATLARDQTVNYQPVPGDSLTGPRSVYAAALGNPSCPPGLLQKHSAKLDYETRQAIGANISCPPAVLSDLAGDPHWEVRHAVAGNPGCLPSALERLIRDPDRGVAQTAANNPSLPRSVLAMWQLSSADNTQ